MTYIAEIKYSCGHYRTAFVRSSGLSGAHYRDLKCCRCRAKENAKITVIAEVVIKGNKAPDFGMGKGVLAQQEIMFTDDKGRGFDSPLFQATLLEHRGRILDEVVTVRFTQKKRTNRPKGQKRK